MLWPAARQFLQHLQPNKTAKQILTLIEIVFRIMNNYAMECL
jgi:hypothetical protein